MGNTCGGSSRGDRWGAARSGILYADTPRDALASRLASGPAPLNANTPAPHSQHADRIGLLALVAQMLEARVAVRDAMRAQRGRPRSPRHRVRVVNLVGNGN